MNAAEEQLRVQRILRERQKSANERELEKFMDEEREERIKDELQFERTKREQDIRFNHNPINVENITNKNDWEVLKEKNQFSGNGCIFKNQENILKNDNNLLKNNMRLVSGRCTL